MTFYEIQQELNEKIITAISDHVWARGEKARARTFKAPIRKVVAEEGFEVIKCATSMGRWCTCCHEDCDQSFPVRKLHVILSKGENNWCLIYHI